MKNRITSEIVVIGFIILVSAVLCWPLINPGLFQIHDDQQVARLFLFDQALSAGQFPVRWVSGLGFGFGYPLFVFYPPFVYALSELIHLTGAGFVDSIKIVFALSLVLSGISMYLLGKSFSGRLGGLVAAVFYMATPYRALDVYARGALSEAFSFVWLPLVILSFYKLSQGKHVSNKYILLGIFSLAFLMTTHNLVFLPFTLFLVPFIAYLFVTSANKKIFSVSSFLTLVLSAGLSAFFWIPSLLEKQYTIVDQMLLTSLANYNIHFVYFQQLWNWPWGFGGSAPGLEDGISFKIGKLNIVLTFVSALLALLVMKYRNRQPQARLTVLFFALFIFAGFMTTSYSQIIWQMLPPLAYLQFPWRFLIFTTLFSAILAGLFIYLVRLPILRIIFAVLLVVLLLVPNIKLFQPQFYRSWLTDQEATGSQVISWDVSSTSFEYVPKGVALHKGKNGVNVLNLEQREIPKNPIELLEGQGEVKNLSVLSNQIKFNMQASVKTTVRANLFNFPLWVVKVDGRSVRINDTNQLKLITFTVPAGSHAVEIKFEDTTVRKIANIISVLSLFLVILLTLKKWNKISV